MLNSSFVSFFSASIRIKRATTSANSNALNESCSGLPWGICFSGIVQRVTPRLRQGISRRLSRLKPAQSSDDSLFLPNPLLKILGQLVGDTVRFNHVVMVKHVKMMLKLAADRFHFLVSEDKDRFTLRALSLRCFFAHDFMTASFNSCKAAIACFLSTAGLFFSCACGRADPKKDHSRLRSAILVRLAKTLTIQPNS